jgi:hypothetical protein
LPRDGDQRAHERADQPKENSKKKRDAGRDSDANQQSTASMDSNADWVSLPPLPSSTNPLNFNEKFVSVDEHWETESLDLEMIAWGLLLL